MLPSFPELTLNGVALKESSELIILGVTFDPKLSFERHVRSVAASASQKIGIMRRGLKIFDSVEVVYRCFNPYLRSGMLECQQHQRCCHILKY